MRGFSYHFLILMTSCFIVSVFNQTFFSSLSTFFPAYKIACIWVFMLFMISLCFELLCYGKLSKVVLILFLLFCCISAFFIDTLHIGITPDIIQSVFNTHFSEVKGFLNLNLFSTIFLYAILPSIFIYFYPIKYTPLFWRSICKIFFISLYALTSLSLWSFVIGKDLIYLLTTQHRFQYTIVPISPIRSTIMMLHDQKQKLSMPYKQIALDATMNNIKRKKILVLVIGESLRSSQLHQYPRELMPKTKSHSQLVNFSNFSSCGVITAISVPCMLTHYTHETYTNRYLSNFTDNILDITQRVGVKTYWLDSNSGSAQNCIGGVCNRMSNVYYFDDLDEVMFNTFNTLTQNLNTHENYFFLLHTLGSHGPDYFRRYPQEFEIFQPICKEKNPNLCTSEELINAYDNSVLYTDSLLHLAISRLEQLQGEFDVSLWYISDHGESLGELGNYMHGGLPYALAPKNQTQVVALAWFGKNLRDEYKNFKIKENSPLSQDYIFHSVLGFFKIKTNIYQKSLDLTAF